MIFFRYFICISPRTQQHLLLTVSNAVHESKSEMKNNIELLSKTKSMVLIQNVACQNINYQFE